MGVHGLWRLVNATGKEVPLETLEGKILAIDISIWMHQVIQGYQDRFGNPKPNAHLIGLFHRICKLLYYKIKPVFVFDGGVPMLKKDTIALRRKQKSMAKNKAQQMRTELINNLIKHSTVKTALNTENITNESSEVIINLQNKQTVDDIFKLPNMPSTSKAESSSNDIYDSFSDSSDELSPRKQTKWIGNIHNVDVTSAEFKDLPADVRYEILTDLKETRKQSSWGRLHEMPEESNEFSGFQMKRLLKRRLVQQSLENAEKEMGGKTLTLEELDKLLKEQGIPTDIQNYTHRIAADNTTRLIYISDKNAYFKNKNNVNSNNENVQNNEHEIDKVIAGPSKSTSIRDDINEYELNDDWDSDIEITAKNKFTSEKNNDTESETESRESRTLSKKYLKSNISNPALTYMLEYSRLTEKQIHALLENNGEMCKNVENASRISEQTDSHKIDNCDDKSNFLNAQNLNPESENENCTNVELIDESKILSETNTETNINLSPIKIANISNEAQFESKTETIISSTDSDSDDFVEIKDIPASKENTIVNNYVSQQSIQITFKSDEKVEDDMFADIFETSNNKLNLDKETSKNKITFEKEVVESTENQIKDNQLFNAKKFDNINKQSDIDIDPNILNTNVQLKENQIENKTNIEKMTNVSKNNVENTNIKDNTNINALSNPIEKISPIPMNENKLLSLQAQLEDKQTELIANIGKLERQGIDISDQIRIEAQELLRLFGVPYLIAPMEAEAQCAYLEQIHLTDGTITDDSDIWLFGGQCVYKNFFNNNKKVLEFRACDIQRYFKLTRNEMIRLALLVGSDYTTGLTGIGPVTALEILAAFPSEGDNLLQGLVNFCSWIENGKASAPGKTSLRTKLQNLKIQKGFPSQAVVQAYLSPMVDESKETFTWGKPNLVFLGDYAKQKFGWDNDKYNKTILPVMKKLTEKQIQNRIEEYFKMQTIPKSIEVNLSQRIQKAVQKLNTDDIQDFKHIVEKMQSLTKQKSSNKNQKKRKELKNEQTLTDSAKPKIFSVSTFNEKNVDEYIPQREHDKANALKNKLHAIEVLRKSKQGLYKTKKIKRYIRKIKREAELSESDSSSS